MSPTASRGRSYRRAIMPFIFKSRYQHKAFIDITPLIDLSFNLILFFMVSYSMGTISSIMVHLPGAAQAGNYRGSDVVITVTEKNEIYVNDVQYDMPSLAAEMKKRKASMKDGVVVIRGDKKSNYETIVKVMDVLNQAGIPKFTLAAVKTQ